MSQKKIPLEKLTYEYIGSSNNKKELEDIVNCLRNGDEGFFPDLTKFAENKLMDIEPNSRLFRETTPLLDKSAISPECLQKIENSVREWEHEIKCVDSVLYQSAGAEGSKLPPIRTFKTPEDNIQPNKGSKTNMQEPRIKQGDYKSWDNFDVDAALMKIDVEEEKVKEQENKARLCNEKYQNDLTNNSINVSEAIQGRTPEEVKLLSEKAKEKGNEYFKEGDWQKAYSCYTESLQLSPNCAAYNNRAMTLIKLKRYAEAVRDCNYVLERESNNVKALLRRSSAYRNLPNRDEWMRGLKDLEKVISLEPNNKTAQSEYKLLRKELNLPENNSKVRLEIEDIPRERLPITFYGESTSSFRCERNSMAHRMYAGPMMNCRGDVPCICNRGLLRLNPLCRMCGEYTMEMLKRKSRVGVKVDPSLCATYVVERKMRRKVAKLSNESSLVDDNLTLQRKTSTMVSRVEQAEEKLCELKIDDCKSIEGTALASSSGALSSPLKEAMDKNLNLSVTSKGCDKADDEESRQKQLALAAKERGNECMAAEDLKRALAYYTTSLNLYADPQTYLLRAKLFEKLKKFEDAAGDYTRVLEKESCLNAAIGRISVLFNAVPVNYQLVSDYVTKALGLWPGNNRIRMLQLRLEKELLNCGNKIVVNENNTSSASPGKSKASISETHCCNGNHQHQQPEDKKLDRNHPKKRKRGAKHNQIDAVKPVADLTNGNHSNHTCKETDKLPPGFQFFSSWDTLKKIDPDFSIRVKLLRKVPPKLLVYVIGENLDSELLGDLLQCLELMLPNESESVAQYLAELPKLNRFQTIRFFMNDGDCQRIKRLINVLADKKILPADVSSRLLK